MPNPALSAPRVYRGAEGSWFVGSKPVILTSIDKLAPLDKLGGRKHSLPNIPLPNIPLPELVEGPKGLRVLGLMPGILILVNKLAPFDKLRERRNSPPLPELVEGSWT